MGGRSQPGLFDEPEADPARIQHAVVAVAITKVNADGQSSRDGDNVFLGSLLLGPQEPGFSLGPYGTPLRRLAFSSHLCAELKAFSDWNDGRSQAELNFNFYRQSINKIVGLSDGAVGFLRRFF